ncbi:Mu transposase C-terminal domain-containing protein [Arthrobacter sp. AL08]|uniref:Mu transposase C-terminal domain-containing protein n=1 Tax=unclassified Arthrobacter TaxID=235627 RepID=UPI0032B39D28
MPTSLEELDGLLLTVPKSRVVQRDGIHFQGQRYLAPTLAPFVGHTVTIRYDRATSPRSASTTATPSSALPSMRPTPISG